MRTMLWLAVFFLGSAQIFGGELRTWHAAVGAFKVEAELVSQTDALVVLKKPDGTELKVPKEKLSAADLTFLAGLAKVPSIPPATPPATPAPSPTATTDSASKNGKPASEKTTATANNTWAKISDPPVADEPGTDYAALVKELMTVPPPLAFGKLRQFKLELPSPETAVLAEGGRFLCTHDAANNKLDVWDLSTGKISHTWNCGPLANPRCFAISPTGKYLAIGRDDHVALTYEVATSKILYDHKFMKKSEKHLYRVAIPWSEDFLYFMSEEGNLNAFPLGGGDGLGLVLPELVTTLPWSVDDKTELRVSGTGTVGVNNLPKNYYSLAFHKNRYFTVIVKFDEPIAAATPVRHGLLRSDGKNFFRLTRVADENGMPHKDQKRVGSAAFLRTVPRIAAVDREENYAWCYGQAMDDPAVDIYSLDEFELPLTVKVPRPAKPLAAADREWIVPEARRLLRWCDADKQLTVFGIGKIEPLPSWKIHGTLHRLLLEKKYERLDALAAELQKERGIPGGTGKPMLTQIIMGFHEAQFYVEPWDWDQRLETWVKERPKSALARLVLANHRVCEGWAARGSGSANSVTEEGWAKFRAMGEVGEQLLKPLFNQPEPPADAFFLQLRIAKMLSWEPEKQLELATQMLRVAPNHAPFHEEMVVNLLPRWFGAPGLSGKYAEKVAERLGAGPGDYLYARMGVSLANYTGPQTYVEETGFDLKRILNALLLELSQNPDDSYQQLRFHGFVIYASQAQPGILDKELNEAMSKVTDGFTKSLADLTWNPYAVSQSKILKQVFVQAAARNK